MPHHYVFNGDADGLCALQQLLLENRDCGSLVTGVKREIDIVQRVHADAGDTVTVLDLSYKSNAPAVHALLQRGVRVRYFDHHAFVAPDADSNFECHVDTSAETCTSLIVNSHLGGRWRSWASVGAFGDNLAGPALKAIAADALPANAQDTLRALGICINYNAYGDTIEELAVAPLDLHACLIEHADPLVFCREDPVFGKLRARLAEDLAHAAATPVLATNPNATILLLADAPWARRVSGVWAHALAEQAPQRAHAVITVKPGGGYVVSVRAPLARPSGAASLCARFPTGGGREGAAGINLLPAARLDEFCEAFLRHFTGPAAA